MDIRVTLCKGNWKDKQMQSFTLKFSIFCECHRKSARPQNLRKYPSAPRNGLWSFVHENPRTNGRIYTCIQNMPVSNLYQDSGYHDWFFCGFPQALPSPTQITAIVARLGHSHLCSNVSHSCRQSETKASWSKNHKTTNMFHFNKPHVSYIIQSAMLCDSGRGVSLTNHSHLVPRLKKE
jgi:hypothetical protein